MRKTRGQKGRPKTPELLTSQGAIAEHLGVSLKKLRKMASVGSHLAAAIRVEQRGQKCRWLAWTQDLDAAVAADSGTESLPSLSEYRSKSIGGK